MGFNPFINDSGGGGGVGPRGPKGPAGESAYEIWLDEGNTGTEQDFLDSWKGEPGPAGPQGPQGVKGETGSQGPQGEAGAAGAAGAKGETGNGIDDIEKTSTSGKVDTYTINFTDGTTSTFSVTNGTDGQNGQPGKDGADGADGQPGQDGVDGVSVTDVEVNSSNHLIVTLSDSTEVDAGEVQGRLTVLTYGTSTWNDFLTAYRNNTLVYCKAYSSGSQTRLAFMAYVNNDKTPTEVEFQYYRSVSTKSLSNQCDQVIIYKLDNTGTWTTTTRNTDIKFTAGDGLVANYANSTLTFAHTNSVTAKTTQEFAQIAYDAQGHITGSTAATTAQADAINSGITSADVAQITTNETSISTLEEMNGAKNNFDINSITPDSGTTIGGDDVTFTNSKTMAFTVPKTGKYYLIADVKSVSVTGSAYLFVKQGDTNLVGYTFENTGTLNLNFTVSDVSNLAILININSATITLGNIMIISEDMYNAGFTDYQPYALSNVELTAKEQANENNISTLVDSGAKNKLNLYGISPTIPSGLTMTQEGNKYVVSGTVSATSVISFTNIPKIDGTLILSGCPMGGSPTGYSMDVKNVVNDTGSGSAPFTLTGAFELRFRFAAGTYENVEFMPMICSEHDWKISHDFAPYALSNAELTGKVKAHSEGGTDYDVINGIRVYVSATQPTGDIPVGSLWIGG